MEQTLDWMDWRNDLPLLTDLLPEKVRQLDLEKWAATLGEKPCRNTLALMGLATLIFYQVERKHNPKVNDIWDALVYCSTCFSVGYGDIFARTPIGKILGSALMTVGPALTGSMLEGPAESRNAQDREILDTLQQILAELKRVAPTAEKA
jgi:hypothetical protein